MKNYFTNVVISFTIYEHYVKSSFGYFQIYWHGNKSDEAIAR